MPDRVVADDLVSDSLELLSVFRTIDNAGLRRTIIAFAYALRPTSYGASLWGKHRPRQPPDRPGH